MTDEDFPFVQKRFFDEYAAWTAVERVDASKLMARMPQLRLVPKGVDQPTKVPPETIAPPVFKAKPIPKAMTDAELRDRREMLRQQTEALRARSRQEAEPQERNTPTRAKMSQRGGNTE
jgi:hypothetical protein